MYSTGAVAWPPSLKSNSRSSASPFLLFLSARLTPFCQECFQEDFHVDLKNNVTIYELNNFFSRQSF